MRVEAECDDNRLPGLEQGQALVALDLREAFDRRTRVLAFNGREWRDLEAREETKLVQDGPMVREEVLAGALEELRGETAL